MQFDVNHWQRKFGAIPERSSSAQWYELKKRVPLCFVLIYLQGGDVVTGKAK
jgi:hypothetical protein